MKKLKPLTKHEKVELWSTVDNEGFGYYMLDYGPDLQLIARMGFDADKVHEAIKIFSEIHETIRGFEEFVDKE